MARFSPDNSVTNKIPDISMTCFEFPDISRFARQVVSATDYNRTGQAITSREQTGPPLHADHEHQVNSELTTH